VGHIYSSFPSDRFHVDVFGCQTGFVLANPDDVGESRFWTVAPFGALGVLFAAPVTVLTPCDTSGFDVAEP
jgi:hypothetical protein